MVQICCPELALRKSSFWTKAKDDILRANFNEHMRLDLMLLALAVGSRSERRIKARLRELDLWRFAAKEEQSHLGQSMRANRVRTIAAKKATEFA